MTVENIPFNAINKDRAKDFYVSAEIKFNQGNWEDARQALKECFRYDPTYKEAFELAANLYLKIRQTDSAIKVLDNYSKILASPNKEYYLLRAKAHLQGGNLDECKKALDQCFSFKRDFDSALFILADYHLKAKRIGEAISIYERLHEKDKSNKDILYSLAKAYFEQKEWDGAIIYCSKLIEAKVNHPGVNEIYRKSLDEKKKHLKEDKNRTLWQHIFAFLYDPETERRLKVHSEQEWQLKRANQRGYLDEKTGILNFQALQDRFPALIGATEQSVYVGFLDINYFKFYNDFYGSHAVGDLVLKAVGKVGTEIFPNWFFRRSGDEFIFVFNGPEEDLKLRSEQFRATCEDQAVAVANELIIKSEPPLLDPKTLQPYVVTRKISTSIGLAQYGPDGRDLLQVLEAAEKQFKITHDGRKNAVVFQGQIVSSGDIPDKPAVGGR